MIFNQNENSLLKHADKHASGGADPLSVADIAYLGNNVIRSVEDDTTANWKALGTGYAYYSTEGLLIDQPSTYGFLKQTVQGANVEQEWIVMPGGKAYRRAGNASGWSGTWIGAATIADIDNHANSKENPHGVTAKQVGLGNVPNVATNNQTPSYTEASTLATLTSGEKLSVSFGKIMKAITDLITHIGSKSNPHSVTAAQVSAAPVTHATQHASSGSDPITPSDIGAVAGTWTIYSELTSLGLTEATATIDAIYSALPNYSELHINVNASWSDDVTPSKYGTLHMVKVIGGRAYATFDQVSGKKYFGAFSATSVFSGWNEIATSTDVSDAVAELVSKAGDTMTGDLILYGNGKAYYIEDSDSGGSCKISKNASSNADYGLCLYDYGSDESYAALVIRNDIGKMFFTTREGSDGTVAQNEVYHRGNITAGTTDLTAGTSALTSGAIYQMYE